MKLSSYSCSRVPRLFRFTLRREPTYSRTPNFTAVLQFSCIEEVSLVPCSRVPRLLDPLFVPRPNRGQQQTSQFVIVKMLLSYSSYSMLCSRFLGSASNERRSRGDLCTPTQYSSGSPSHRFQQSKLRNAAVVRPARPRRTQLYQYV